MNSELITRRNTVLVPSLRMVAAVLDENPDVRWRYIESALKQASISGTVEGVAIELAHIAADSMRASAIDDPLSPVLHAIAEQLDAAESDQRTADRPSLVGYIALASGKRRPTGYCTTGNGLSPADAHHPNERHAPMFETGYGLDYEVISTQYGPELEVTFPGNVTVPFDSDAADHLAAVLDAFCAFVKRQQRLDH